MEPYQKLERAWADLYGKKYGVSTNTGTAAIHLALMAVGVGKGDEVIVPDFSMAAVAFAVSYTGAKPVFARCGTDLNIDPAHVSELVTKKTKAIVPVHIYGRLCDMQAINEIATRHKLWVIEDACEVHGAPVGNAHITCFSFYRNKIVCAEEGGMALTNLKVLADRMNYLKNMAMGPVRDYRHTEVGYNYRISNANAKLALKSMSHMKRNLKRRRKIESWYNKYLNVATGGRAVVWVFDVLTTPTLKSQILKEIPGSRPFFVPMTQLPMYKGKTDILTDIISNCGVYLPVEPTMSRWQVRKICRKIKRMSKSKTFDVVCVVKS